jgi:DHA2 family multidrug resistance protein-like MFS transporter
MIEAVNPADGLPLSQRRWVMGCIMLGMVLSSLDSSIANIALPSIAHSLMTSDAAVVLVINGYQLAATVCLLPVAALSESQGFKRVYAPGMGIFTLASLCCALSPSLPILVASRVVQGAGGACMSVAGMAIVRSIYPSSIVSRGFALIALSVAVAAALGPTVASSILAVAHWPWLFLVNVPLGLCALPIFIKLAPAGKRQSRPFDFAGAVLNALAFGFVVVGIGSLGIGQAAIASCEIILGLAFFAVFVIQQTKRLVPLLPLDLIRIPIFALSIGTSTCSYAAQILAYASLPFLFERSLGLNPVQTGLFLTPWPLLVALAAPIAARLTTRYPASIITTLGMALLSAGLCLLAALPSAPTKLDIIWRMALCGIGFGLFQTPNNTAMMMSGPPERSGAAAGMNAVARYLGWSLGSAVVALIFGLAGPAATIRCLETGAVFAGAGAFFSGARWRSRERAARRA